MPGLVPGFPLCGHGHSMNIAAIDMTARHSCCSNDPTAEALTIRAFEYLTRKSSCFRVE
jgi:hypothetical protein